MMASKKKCRQYREGYLAFGFVESPRDQHLKRKHRDKVDRIRAYFEHLKKNSDQRNTLSAYLKKSSQINESGLTASFEIAQIIAKTGSAHTVAEMLLSLLLKFS